MNRLEGHIDNIRTHGPLSLVTVSLPGSLQIRAIVIEQPETGSYLNEGKEIAVLFKETEVILCGSGAADLSIQNRIPAAVAHIEAGDLLSRVVLRTGAGAVEAIVPTDSIQAMGLEKGRDLLVLVKTNEVMLSDL